MADLDYKVVVEDLTTDAAQWDRVAAVIATAQETAAELQLQWAVLDGIAYDLHFGDQYDAAQKHIADYLAAGNTAMTGIADKLRATASHYRAAEK